MKITGVSVNECRRYVPLKGWESVTKALTDFASGATCHSRSAETKSINDIGESSADGAMAVGLYLYAGALTGGRSDFVDRLLAEAKTKLSSKDGFSKSYDYDGVGAFHKTIVDIKVLDRKQDLYGIGLYAAYVGEKPEEGLAAHLGFPRTLLWCAVETKTKPRGKRFEFDFERTLRLLDPTLGTEGIAGTSVVEALMASKDDDSPSFALPDKDGFILRIGPGRIGQRLMYERGKEPHDTWSAVQAKFSGELARDYTSPDPKATRAPTFLITVSSGTGPIWQPDRQARAVALANEIAAALR